MLVGHEAWPRLWELLELHVPTTHVIILHGYTADADTIVDILKRYPNCYVSLSGLVSHRKQTTLAPIIFDLPLSRLLLASWAPEHAPSQCIPASRVSGHRNVVVCYPWHLVWTASVVSSIKGITIDQVMQAAAENAVRALQPTFQHPHLNRRDLHRPAHSQVPCHRR